MNRRGPLKYFNELYYIWNEEGNLENYETNPFEKGMQWEHDTQQVKCTWEKFRYIA